LSVNGALPLSRTRKPFYGWWILLSAASVLMTGFALSAYAFPVFYPELVAEFGWPRASVALGGSVKTLLVGLVAPLNGWIIDRRGVKSLLLAGVVTMGAGTALLSGIGELWQYFAICVLLGFGASWTHHFPTQMLVANWFAKRRGLMIGTLTTLSGIGNTLLPILTAALIVGRGWREALLILPLLLAVPLVAVAFLVRNHPEDMGLLPDGTAQPPESGGGQKPAAAERVDSGDWLFLRSQTFWMIGGMMLLSAWGSFAVWHHIVLFLRDVGYSATAAASIFSLFIGSTTISRFLSGPLCDRISPTLAMLLNLGFIAASLVLLSFGRGPGVIYSSMVILGLGYGGIVTCRPMLIFEHYGSGVGKIYGAATAMYTTGSFAGPVLSGYVHDRTGSYDLAFALSLVLVCASMILMVPLRRSGPQSKPSSIRPSV
jgi:MFS family permease